MPEDPAAERGLDGLTAAELRASRRGFWDEAFTAVLLGLVPPGAARLLDVGCGLASAAHALLPALPAVAYLGVDADEGRLASARVAIAAEPWATRAELRAGRAERLPCADAAVDVALVAMTLQHLPDPLAALLEIARVLRPSGRLVAVEPDNLSNLFYFDGPLEEVTAAFRGVATELRRARHPADPAIGPGLASLVERAGFTIRALFPHLVGGSRRDTAKAFLDRVRQVLAVMASGRPGNGTLVAACRAAIDRTEAALGPGRVGYGSQLVPLFVCAADRP